MLAHLGRCRDETRQDRQREHLQISAPNLHQIGFESTQSVTIVLERPGPESTLVLQIRGKSGRACFKWLSHFRSEPMVTRVARNDAKEPVQKRAAKVSVLSLAFVAPVTAACEPIGKERLDSPFCFVETMDTLRLGKRPKLQQHRNPTIDAASGVSLLTKCSYIEFYTWPKPRPADAVEGFGHEKEALQHLQPPFQDGEPDDALGEPRSLCGPFSRRIQKNQRLAQPRTHNPSGHITTNMFPGTYS
jgi:hypothetical protein